MKNGRLSRMRPSPTSKVGTIKCSKWVFFLQARWTWEYPDAEDLNFTLYQLYIFYQVIGIPKFETYFLVKAKNWIPRNISVFILEAAWRTIVVTEEWTRGDWHDKRHKVGYTPGNVARRSLHMSAFVKSVNLKSLLSKWWYSEWRRDHIMTYIHDRTEALGSRFGADCLCGNV